MVCYTPSEVTQLNIILRGSENIECVTTWGTRPKRGFGILARATKPSETEAVTHPSTNIVHCCLTPVKRQILITLCHNS